MKKIYLMLLVFLANFSFAQEVSIGTGTTQGQPVPVDPFFGYTYAQTIYPSTSIGYNGTITGLKFYLPAGANITSSNDWTIWLGQTTKTSFTSTTDWVPTSSMTQVFSGTVTNVSGVVTITLSTPFNFTADNLVIAVDENAASFNASSDRFYVHTGPANSSIFFRDDDVADNPDPAAPPTAGGRLTSRPNVTFVGIGPSCVAPTSGSVSNQTLSSATLNWTASSSSPSNGYDYYYIDNTTPPTGSTTPSGSVGAGVLTANIAGLTANTSYNGWVRAKCGASDLSTWFGPIPFRTGYCLPSSTAPDTYINNFSTTGGTANISNLATGYTTGGYADYFATQNATTTTVGTLGFNLALVGGTVGASIWVDFNNNLQFETTERLFNTTGYTNGPITGSLTMPAGTNPGEYRMRALIHYNASNPADPCASNARLEAEDYKLTVVAQPTDAMDWVNLQFPPTASTPAGGTGETIYTRGYEPGVTEAAGAGAGISVWIGVSPEGAAASSDPATWTTWIPAAFNVQSGNDDEFSAAIGGTLAPGNYRYASRWALNGGPFRYGGYNAGGGGIWDGTANVSGVLTVTAPLGDDPCGAITLTVDASSAYCVNTTAYTSAGDPDISSCSTPNNTVWFQFTPTQSGIHTITASVPAASTNGLSGWLYLYTAAGTCPTLTFTGAGGIACTAGPAAATPGTVTAVNTTSLTAGTTYYLLLDGNSGDVGDACIRITRPACVTPTATAATAIASTTANANWTPNTGNFIIEYGPTATFTPVGTGATAGNANNFVVTASNVGTLQLTGLSVSTGYSYVVRQDCTGTGGGFSNNSNTITFTTLSPPPANDNCGTATAITSLPYSFSQADGSGATQTAFVSTCGTGMNDGVWYTITGTGCGLTITIDPTTSWDPELAVYSGSCGTFTCVGFADDGGSGTEETVTFNAAAGTVYYINIGHYSGTGDNPEGPFDISVSACITLPANDECTGAVPIGIAPVSGTLVNATTSLPAGSCDIDTQDPNDVWFQFTATSAGDAIVTVAPSTGDVVVEAFTGTCGGTLTSIGCNDLSFGTENLTLTGLTAGQTVFVRVYGYEEDESVFDISVSGAALPVAIEYFRGTKQNNRNVLDWKVSCTGSPSVTLVLERSADGRNYQPIFSSNETATRCLQPFTQNDLQPLAGLNYYRLKTIDIDGKIGYSTVVVLMGKDKGFEIVSLAPNPVKNNAVLTVTSAERTIMEVVVRDINGKLVSKQRISLIAGSNQVSLSVDKIAAGVYTVSGLTADGVVRTLKFVKE